MEKHIVAHLTYPQFKAVKDYLVLERVEFTTKLNKITISVDDADKLEMVKKFCLELDRTISIKKL